MASLLDAAADQVPFALSQALNDAAEKTRDRLINETWPSHVTVRNKSFMKGALSTKGERATKRKLSVTIYDKLGRASLKKHAEGGVKQGKGRLAIPSAKVSRGASGVRKTQRPANLQNKVVKGNAIYQRVGKGKRSKLKLMYGLARQARIKQDVPFESDFRRFMTEEVQRAFPGRIQAAMKTRR
ncbi:hypothetical protein SAMN05216548_12724 [Faunimonas pinastri]|uniref:Uncharacterized protein n=1 Tax=Faunimonas pinastri TaxID=1855383 RepID=A0A1H9QE71_9HYPH|nr:hypothetical protein [Faunimonas pinastri]SER58754.1 hypothetical protein SAMN05216548_12724 [Faunimonas pinastri]